MKLNEKFVSVLAEKLSMDAEVLKKAAVAEQEAEVEEFATGLQGKELYSEKQIDDLKKNMRGEGKEEGINEGIGRAYGLMDKRGYEFSGIEKHHGEKSEDYYKRIINTLRDKDGKGKIDKDEEFQKHKRLVAEKEQAIENLIKENDDLKKEAEQQKKQFSIDHALSTVINQIPIDADEKLIQAQRDFIRHQLGQKFDYDLIDGKVVFKDKSGQEVKDPKTTNYRTPEEIIKEFAPSVVKLRENGVPKGGAGLKPSPITKESLDSVDIKKYKDINEYKSALTESGISLGSQEGQKAISKFIEERSAQPA